MPKYEVMPTKLWGIVRWMILLDGEFHAGLFDSLRDAQAFVERNTR